MLNGQIITLKKGLQYKVLKSLVKSEQVNIWEVKQLDNQQHYALKVVNQYQFGHLEKTKLLIDYTQAEIDFLSSLNEPAQHHIAPCVDAGLVEQVGYRLPSMIMPLELYQHDDLAVFIKKINSRQVLLTSEKWLTWFQQLMSALQCMQRHSSKNKPLIHRNIQPKNCLLDADQQLFLTDFSLVQKSHESSKNAFLDNVDYCAPEQLLEQSSTKLVITPAADIYAVAMVMHELVAGKISAQEELNHLALNNLITEEKLGDIKGVTEQEAAYLQTQLQNLFSVAKHSSETRVTKNTQQLTRLLQTMLAPLPQARPHITKVVKQLETVIADLKPEIPRTQAKVDIPPTVQPQQPQQTHNAHNAQQDIDTDTIEQTKTREKKQTQQVVPTDNNKNTHYFSGEWHIYSSMALNIVGNDDSVLVIHNDVAITGHIKCQELYIETYATVTGNITAHKLHIDGKVIGDVYAHTLSVGVMNKVAIKGDVKSFNVLLNGTVEGEIHALESLELLPQAITTGGDVYFQHMNMEVGAQVNGRLINYTDTDADRLLLIEQSLQQQLELEKAHNVDTAIHYFSTDHVVDFSVKTNFISHGHDGETLTIKSGVSVIGDINCYALEIEQGATVTGTIKCNRINSTGNSVGDIYGDTLWIGSPSETNPSNMATVNGQVKCYQLNLNGVIHGDVYVVKYTVLLAKAKIMGSLYYNELEMQGGAETVELLMINGTDQHRALQHELEESIPQYSEESAHINNKNSDAGTSRSLGMWLLFLGALMFFLFLFSAM